MDKPTDNTARIFVALVFEHVPELPGVHFPFKAGPINVAGKPWIYCSMHVAANDTHEAERIFWDSIDHLYLHEHYRHRYFILTDAFAMVVWSGSKGTEMAGGLTEAQFKKWESMMATSKGNVTAPYREIKKVKPLYIVDGQGVKNEKG